VTILTVLLSVTVYSAVIYAAIMLFRLIFKKHASPRMMYMVWLLLILRLLIPVTIDSGFSLIMLPPSNGSQVQSGLSAPENESGGGALHTYEVAPAAIVDGGQQDTAAQYTAAAQPGFTWGQPEVLAAAWILGMALMLVQTFAAWVKLRLRISRDALPVPQEWLDIAEKVKTELNIHVRVRMVMIRDFVSPALNAGIYPTIVMPEQMAEQDTERIEFALRHEMTHLKRRDHLVCLLLVILRIVYWFNPVVWLASKQIKMDMETACDSAAVRPMDRDVTKRYAETVLDMYATEKVRFVLGMGLHSTKKTAERRVRGIFMRKRSSIPSKAAAAVLAAVLLVACFTTACQPVTAEPSDTANVGTPTATVAVSAETGAPSATPEVESSPTPASTPTIQPTATPASIPTPTQTHTDEPVAALPPGVTAQKKFTADLNGDGTEETIAVCSVKGSYEIRLYVLYAGGYDKTVVGDGTFKSAYLTRTGNGDRCLLVSIDEASEDYLTFPISFNGTDASVHGETFGYAYGVSGTKVTLSGHLDVIGTWDYTREYKLKNDFTLEKTSDYTILKNWMEPLHTIRTLPVEMLAGGAYAAGTLPAGTSLQPISTDGSSYIRFKLDDGSTGRILFTRGSNVEVYIDGVIESEYFDNIAYSD
jgi:beta-lactamase regulating signal transducer with metallopeptidase domain